MLEGASDRAVAVVGGGGGSGSGSGSGFGEFDIGDCFWRWRSCCCCWSIREYEEVDTVVAAVTEDVITGDGPCGWVWCCR